MAPHSSTFAWKIPWTAKPGRLQSMGSLESDTTERLHFHFSLSRIGQGNGNPLQCSCLENPRDGGAWWAAVYGVAQSDTTEATQHQQQQSDSDAKKPCSWVFSSVLARCLVTSGLFLLIYIWFVLGLFGKPNPEALYLLLSVTAAVLYPGVYSQSAEFSPNTYYYQQSADLLEA